MIYRELEYCLAISSRAKQDVNTSIFEQTISFSSRSRDLERTSNKLKDGGEFDNPQDCETRKRFTIRKVANYPNSYLESLILAQGER